MWRSIRLIRELLNQRSASLCRERQLTDPACSPEVLFETGKSCVAAHQYFQAIKHFQAAIRLRGDFPAASIKLASLLRQTGNLNEAIGVLRKARDASPTNQEIIARLRQLLGTGLVPMWHFSMMNDQLRNSAYERAIHCIVTQADSVLEIGTGSGLMAMLVARSGAKKVTTCEIIESLADKAREIIKINGYAEQISVIASSSSEVRIPDHLTEPADVLIAEIVSSDLLGEGILDSYDDAKRRLLKPDAIVIPSKAAIVAQLVGYEKIDPILRVHRLAGFDMGAFNEFTPVTLYPGQFGLEHIAYSDNFEVFVFDLQKDLCVPPQTQIITVEVTQSGICYGILQWIRLELCEGIQYENSPGTNSQQDIGHWGQVLFTFPEPLTVQMGQSLKFIAEHDRNSLWFYGTYDDSA